MVTQPTFNICRSRKTIIRAIFYDYSKLDKKIEQNEKEREIIIAQLKEAKKVAQKHNQHL